jgi:hypothetical protein
MWIRSALASALLAGCTRGEPARPAFIIQRSPTAIVIPPTGAPTASAPPAPSALRAPSSANGGAPFTTRASTACAASEHVGPSSREDLTWAKRVTDLMGKGIDRKRLVCMFGRATGANGDFIAITPHHPSFRVGLALGKHFDHPEESIEVTYVDAEMPQLASVERVFGPSKRTLGHHPEMPREHVFDILDTNDRSIRAIATLADDNRHVAKPHLDVSDLRGWTPPPIRCWDGAHVSVFPPADRHAAGAWTIEATDATSGAPIASFTCNVPEDSLDRGLCAPPGEQPPGAILGSMAKAIDLHLPGQTARIAITLSRDGALVARREVKPRYSTTPAENTPTGTCTSALDFITLRAP